MHAPASPRRFAVLFALLALPLCPVLATATEAEAVPLVLPEVRHGELATRVMVPELSPPSDADPTKSVKAVTDDGLAPISIESGASRLESPTHESQHAEAPRAKASTELDASSISAALEALTAESTSPTATPVPDTADETREAKALAPLAVASPPEPLAPPPLQPLRIMLDWYPGPQHAALLIAQHQGLFTRHGLEVTLLTPADPGLPTRLLAADGVDAALTRQPLLHLQVDRGQPLVRIGTLVDLPLSGLLLRNGTLDSPAALAGKRLGYSTEESRELLLPALLRPHGIRVEELELVDVNFSAVAAMEEQALDALITPQRLILPRRLGDEGVGTKLVNLEALDIPLHEGLILVAHRDRLGNQQERLRRLLAALAEATAWSLEHPEDAWALLAAEEPTLDTPANREAWMPTLLRLSARPAALDLDNYRRFEHFLYARGLLDTLTPTETLAVDLGAL